MKSGSILTDRSILTDKCEIWVDFLFARAQRAPPLFLVCGVVFYVSARLCGAARVLDDVRREAQAGQRTRKARSQVLPCKPRYSAYACLRKDLQAKSTFPEKDFILTSLVYNFMFFYERPLNMRSPDVLVRSSTCPVKNEYGQVRGELQRIISDRVMIETFFGH